MLRKFLQFLIFGRSDLMSKFDVLTEEVAALTDVVASAVAVIDNLATQIEDAKDDPEEIAAIVADLRAQKDSLAAAVAANTTPDVPPPVDPVAPVDPIEE